MKYEWILEKHDFQNTILVADAGGTNVNLGLVGYRDETCTLIAKGSIKSSLVNQFIEPLSDFIKVLERDNRFVMPAVCCIAAAGPVHNNSCQLTNCHWEIEGNQIEEQLNIQTTVINDFIAISHGIPELNHYDPSSIVQIPHCDGHTGAPSSSGVKLVIGPGTGLGVSYIVPHEGSYLPFPSEGGHSDFAAFDEETARLKNYIASSTLVKPGIEPFLSGPGIINIFNFLLKTKNFPMDESLTIIRNSPEENMPELISSHSSKSDICRETIRIFAKILGHVAGSFSSIFLPTGGVYIAGGIAAKNINSFILPGYFMTCFEESYNQAMRELLKTIPVYIVIDYSVSLYGAAKYAAGHLHSVEPVCNP